MLTEVEAVATTFEQGFADIERAAITVTKAASALATTAKQLQKAAHDGDIAAIRKTAERLAEIPRTVQQVAVNAKEAWPFTPEEEEGYLRTAYVEELLAAAAIEGLQLHRQDDHLVAFPSVLRVSPSDRAVKLDRRKVSSLRPSTLVAKLKANQTKKPKFASEKFLETLYAAYRVLVGKDGIGTTVLLSDVHKVLTLLPVAAADYDLSDFARDLFLLDDRSGLRQTKSGARVSLPASTGTKGSRNTLSFVAPDGASVTYYGLRFTETER